MNKTASVQEFGTRKEAREQLKLQLAQYLEQQPESTRTFHRWMKGLEDASLVLVVIVFIVAMYVSINWTSVPITAIPTAWFAFPCSFSLTILLLGLHTVILKAFPPAVGLQTIALRAPSPIVLPEKNQPFIFGREAVGRGGAFIIGGLLLGVFWGLLAYASWTLNWAMLKPLISILAIMVGAGMAISILYSMFQKIFKSC